MMLAQVEFHLQYVFLLSLSVFVCVRVHVRVRVCVNSLKVPLMHTHMWLLRSPTRHRCIGCRHNSTDIVTHADTCCRAYPMPCRV